MKATMPDNGKVKRGRRTEVKEILGPGVWVDGDDHLHFSIPDILHHLGLPDTDENRQMALEVCREKVAEEGGKAFYRATPDDPGTPV